MQSAFFTYFWLHKPSWLYKGKGEQDRMSQCLQFMHVLHNQYIYLKQQLLYIQYVVYN